MKKGQLAEPFKYIFALIVIALIIWFGFFVIQKLISFGGEVGEVKFRTEIKDSIRSVYNLAPGSVDEVKFRVPSNVQYACFVNVDPFKINEIMGKLKGYDEIQDVVGVLLETGGSSKNVFLQVKKGSKDLKESFYEINNLRAKEDVQCFNVLQGVMNLRLENKGKFVEVS